MKKWLTIQHQLGSISCFFRWGLAQISALAHALSCQHGADEKAPALRKQPGARSEPKRVIQTMANVAKKTWTHKVVKQARGMQGQWFSFPAAMTGDEDGALAYAASFADDQRGVAGARITVQSRGGRIVKIIQVQS